MNNVTTRFRAFTLLISVVALLAGFLISNLNIFWVSLIHLALFLVVITIGLLTNIWGGLTVSGIAVFSLVILNQYAGVYPSQNRVINLASEFAIYLVAGPLAGWLSHQFDNHQEGMKRWISLAEDQATHETVFHTLKPQWSKVRLEEEVLRARTYARPLSIALLQFTKINERNREERIAGLQALIRIAQSTTTVPTVVTYLGENRVFLLLPEHTEKQAQELLTEIRSRAETERFFPGKDLGVPLTELGPLKISVVVYSSNDVSADSLLETAIAGLSQEGA